MAGAPAVGEGEVLVFVYNVDASPVALLRDAVRGIRDGQTDCHLCDLTFGRVLKDRGWRAFVDQLPVEVDFQLRSTFVGHHPELAGQGFPAAFAVPTGGAPRQLLSADDIDGVEDLDGLRALVRVALGLS